MTIHPLKKFIRFFKNSSSSTITEVPIVDNDCGFLLGNNDDGNILGQQSVVKRKQKLLVLLKYFLALAYLSLIRIQILIILLMPLLD